MTIKYKALTAIQAAVLANLNTHSQETGALSRALAPTPETKSEPITAALRVLVSRGLAKRAEGDRSQRYFPTTRGIAHVESAALEAPAPGENAPEGVEAAPDAVAAVAPDLETASTIVGNDDHPAEKAA